MDGPPPLPVVVQQAQRVGGRHGEPRRKIAALRAHASQIKEPDALEGRIREWARDEGKPIGVEAAEAHRVIVIEDDEDEGPTHAHEPGTEERGGRLTAGGLSPSRAAAAGRGPGVPGVGEVAGPCTERVHHPAEGQVVGHVDEPVVRGDGRVLVQARDSASRGHVRTRIRSRPA